MTQTQEEKLEKTNLEKRASFLQYLNTFLLSLILGVCIMVANIVSKVNSTQTIHATEIARLTAIQNTNTANIAILTTKIQAIESDKIAALKEWTLANFVMKNK